MTEDKENKSVSSEPAEFGKAVSAKKKIKHSSDRAFMVDGKSVYMHSVKKLWKSVRRYIFSGILAIVFLAVVCAFFNMKNYALGYEVIIDGSVVGYVDDAQVVKDAVNEVRSVVKGYVENGEEYNKKPEYVRRLVDKSECLNKEQVVEYLMSNLDYIVASYGIYVDDKFVTAVSTEEIAKDVLEEYLKRYAGVELTEDTVLETKEKYTYKLDYDHGINEFSSLEEAIAVLSGTDRALEKYTVVAGDTLSGIAQRYGMKSSVEIVALNPNLVNGDTIKVGDEIIVEKAVPLLSVIATREVEYDEKIPFEIEKQDDPTIYQGEYRIVSSGVAGVVRKVAKIKTENGIEVSRDILSSEVLSEPIKEVRRVGTMVPPQFIRPASGYLSSGFGRRWGRNHNGIDVAGAHGSNVVASASGTVTYAGWMSGYGNYVVINHGNGYQTAYGHNSSISVSVGQKVSQGQVIAKMGSTGRSTGTHVHFEIKKNGVFQNPLNYVSY